MNEQARAMMLDTRYPAPIGQHTVTDRAASATSNLSFANTAWTLAATRLSRNDGRRSLPDEGRGPLAVSVYLLNQEVVRVLPNVARRRQPREIGDCPGETEPVIAATFWSLGEAWKASEGSRPAARMFTVIN